MFFYVEDVKWYIKAKELESNKAVRSIITANIFVFENLTYDFRCSTQTVLYLPVACIEVAELVVNGVVPVILTMVPTKPNI